MRRLSELETVDPRLGDLVRIILRYEPERILLFGSRARGEADQYSDYDVVVIKDTTRTFVERLQDMVPFLVEFDRPAEIVVYTPDEFERMANTSFGAAVRREGVILYERTAG